VHALGIAAAHLVPIIVGELELGGGGHLDLGERGEVLEAGFAGGFLGEEIAEMLKLRRVCEPREERIGLAWAVLLQRLEPGNEAIRILGRFGGAAFSLRAQLLHERAFEPLHARILVQLPRPVMGRKGGGEPPLVPPRKRLLEVVIEELRLPGGIAIEGSQVDDPLEIVRLPKLAEAAIVPRGDGRRCRA
jgi:hypothetical protein